MVCRKIPHVVVFLIVLIPNLDLHGVSPCHIWWHWRVTSQNWTWLKVYSKIWWLNLLIMNHKQTIFQEVPNSIQPNISCGWLYVYVYVYLYISYSIISHHITFWAKFFLQSCRLNLRVLFWARKYLLFIFYGFDMISFCFWYGWKYGFFIVCQLVFRGIWFSIWLLYGAKLPP